MFNHESELRGPEFVTRKITRAVARIDQGTQEDVRLGNLEARRDWGYAPEYVDAMWRMLQQETPRDYVIGTGVHHSVRECCEIAFSHLGMDYRNHIRTDAALLRPAEVETLRADPTRARQELGWETRTSFEELVRIMVDADVDLIRTHKLPTPG